MCEKPPVMTVSNTICISAGECDPIVALRGVPREVCVLESVSASWIYEVCVLSQQQAEGRGLLSDTDL